MILDEVDSEARAILEANHFDVASFEELRQGLVDGSRGTFGNAFRGTVEPPLASDLTNLPRQGDASHGAAVDAGSQALREGAIAMVVLAGGMATRFGGGVKAVAEVIDGRSFLDVKLGETARLARDLGCEIPTVLMTSFATDEIVRAHVAERHLGEPLVFRQTAAPRFEPDGRVFLDGDGKASLYGPGHGDLLDSIRLSGTLAELRQRGVHSIAVSNVDNLAARLDPAVIGMHLLAGTPLTVEVVPKGADTGGAPARVDGRPQLVESMRFPEGFDQSSIPVFNTNTAMITVAALEHHVDLTWLVAQKQVNGRVAIQFERLYHELSSYVPTTFLVVPREGDATRFLPVKEPDDLLEARRLVRRFAAA